MKEDMENFKTQWHNEAEPEKEGSNRELPILQLDPKKMEKFVDNSFQNWGWSSNKQFVKDLSCLQHRCQHSLCSSQTCKSLYLPWQNRLLCSYLAHRLSTTMPILCHQVLPGHNFQSCLRRMPPTPHTTLQPDRIFQRQLARLPRHWPLYRRIYDLPQWRTH
jgi:hypothetical protein